MKVAVLGASGLIGRALVEQLNRDGHEVTAVARKPVSEWGYHPMCMAVGSVDLTRDHAFYWCIDQEWVFHVAADTGGRAFTDGQEAACAMNTLIDMNVLRGCLEHKSVRRLFYASSACVYGPMQNWSATPLAWREGDAYDPPPDDMYGRSKLYAEEAYIAVACESDLEVRIARLDGVFGPGAHWKGDRAKAPMALLRKAIEAKRHGGPIDVWGDGKQIRAYLSASDAAVAITRLMASDLQGPVNIGAELVLDMDALARLCMDTAGVRAGLVHVPGPTGPQRRFLSMDKIKNAKVWTPPPLSTALGLYAAHKWLVEQMEMVR